MWKRTTKATQIVGSRTSICASSWQATRSYAFKGPDGRNGFEEAIVLRGPYAGRRGIVSPWKKKRGKNKYSVTFTDTTTDETFSIPLRFIRVIFPSLPGYHPDPIPASAATLDVILGKKEAPVSA